MNLPTTVSLQDLFGLISISLLISAILLRVLMSFRLKKQTSYLISILLFFASFISFDGDSINLYVRGLINDLSITSIILLIYYFIQPKTNKQYSFPVLFLIMISGVFFYPMALGLGPIDPYSWGFMNKADGMVQEIIFLSLLIGFMLVSLRKNYSILLLCLVLSPLAFQLGLLESRNLWDYLIDPLIFIYALIAVPYRLLIKNS